MHPILLELGPLTIFTYGLFVATGFFTAVVLATRQGEKEGIDPNVMMDLCFYILVSAIAGARILYVIVEHKHFMAAPLDVFKVWKGGLVFYGGLILAALTTVFYARWKGLPLWKLADILAPSLALGQAIGRWGCLFAGCCYGVRTDVPWAITFTDPRALAPLNVPLHPTQLYLSFKGLTIFAFLLWLRRRKTFDGQMFWAYGMLYSAARFVIEFYRGDDRGYAIPGALSTSQFIGIFTFAIAAAMYWRLRAAKRKEA